MLKYLEVRPHGIYVDATLGDGGHAGLICRRLSAKGALVGLDMDETSLKRARENLRDYAPRLVLVKDNFRNLREVLRLQGINEVDGILLDLGLSSSQVDRAERGFSFHQEGPLDMRMDGALSLSAHDVVNEYSRDRLARVFRDYGEERWARRVASFIVRHREEKGEISTTGELVEIIKSAVPARYRRRGGHPARRVFQALRIEVNRELENLKEVLPAGVESLREGGRICIISYHSLEDRIVKHFFRERAGCQCPPQVPRCGCTPDLKVITRRPVVPEREEVKINPRARSARLRVAQKIGI